MKILSGYDLADYSSVKVAVAMSGGVDSSLTAVLLKEKGFDVVGITMSLWDYNSSGVNTDDRGCCDLSSINNARSVAFDAGFPHYTINLREEFEKAVVGDFIESYLSGYTPNPCVKCNSIIKWEIFMEKARALGCDLIATGHYARIGKHSDGTYSLLSGKDSAKDQSYFLWGIDSEKLGKTLFPLGDMKKPETRAESLKRHLKTAERAESQEICFIPDNDYGRFLLHRVCGETRSCLFPGDVLDMNGKALGRHRGSAFYTIGQRKGVGIAIGTPAYVTKIDTVRNTVTVGGKEDLLSGTFNVKNVNWIRGFPPAEKFSCKTRIRYRHPGTNSEITVIEGEKAFIRLETPQPAVTPGQSAVFYNGEIVIGGGIIEKEIGD